MVKIIGVKFKNSCKVYYFNPNDVEYVKGEGVIVETSRGVEYGTVAIGTKEVDGNIEVIGDRTITVSGLRVR